MNIILRMVITVLAFVIIFKMGEMSGYEKCAKDAPQALREAILNK